MGNFRVMPHFLKNPEVFESQAPKTHRHASLLYTFKFFGPGRAKWIVEISFYLEFFSEFSFAPDHRVVLGFFSLCWYSRFRRHFLSCWLKVIQKMVLLYVFFLHNPVTWSCYVSSTFLIIYSHEETKPGESTLNTSEQKRSRDRIEREKQEEKGTKNEQRNVNEKKRDGNRQTFHLSISNSN